MKTELLPLVLPLLASVAFATPIRVSGGGTFWIDPVIGDSSFTISFSGSNGVDSITLSAECGGTYLRGNNPANCLGFQ
jgi:hypothetical protein